MGQQSSQSTFIPDVVNKDKGSGYTQVPNILIRTPELSGKAFKILCILTSNQKGWKNYREKLYEMMQEGYTAIDSGLKELQELDFLRKIRYRQISSKQMAGSFWVVAFTPGDHANLDDQKELLENEGLEIFPTDDYSTESHPDGNPGDGSQEDGNKRLRRLIKEKQLKKTNTPDPAGSEESEIEKRSKKYIPLSKHLAKTVRSHIKYKIDSKRIKSWANDLRLLHEQNGVPTQRIKKVLQWYRKNIGGDFIPEAFSGSAFRDKFPKLEAAIQRQDKPSGNDPRGKKTWVGHYEPDHKYKEAEETV